MLIKKAMPRRRSRFQGMDPRVKRIEPGATPPLLHPHCRQCNVPVERFQVRGITDPWFLNVEVTCHGKTTGRRVSHTEALESNMTGKPVWFFERRRGD